MLYLPSLKMPSPIFCRAHPPPEPSGTVSATVAADPVDFEAMATEQNCCTEMQHLLSGSSLRLAFQQAGSQRLVSDVSLEFFVPSSQQNSKKTFICICTTFHTLGVLPLGVLCLLGLSGAASPITSPAGQNPASNASRARSIATPACCHSPYPSLISGLLISTLTWWALYSTVLVATTFSQSLIASKWMKAIPISETSAAACGHA
jgi:hypothetical protein